MASIDYSCSIDTRVAAPIEWVWRYLVDPALMPVSREYVTLAVTAEGVPGEEGHVFFTEVVHGHGAHAFKFKVLRGDTPSVWATLAELAGWSGKEHYTLTRVEGGLFTDIRYLTSVREDVGERTQQELDALRLERTESTKTVELKAAEYFARAVAEAYEAQR